MKQNDLLVAVHSEKIKLGKAINKGDRYQEMLSRQHLASLELLADELGVELISNIPRLDVLTEMLENDEMWVINPDTKAAAIIYDLPLFDC